MEATTQTHDDMEMDIVKIATKRNSGEVDEDDEEVVFGKGTTTGATAKKPRRPRLVRQHYGGAGGARRNVFRSNFRNNRSRVFKDQLGNTYIGPDGKPIYWCLMRVCQCCVCGNEAHVPQHVDIPLLQQGKSDRMCKECYQQSKN